MGDIRNENSYKESLIRSGALRFLTRGELKRMTMFIMRLNGTDLSAYPGKYETEKATGLSHHFTEKIDFVLGKIGLLIARQEVTIKGGKVWKYFLNPEVPILTREKAKAIRKEVRHLSVPTYKGSKDRLFLNEVRLFWGQRQAPSVLKSLTTINNPKEPREDLESLIEKAITDLNKMAKTETIVKWLNVIPEDRHYRIKAFLVERYKNDGAKAYYKAENGYHKGKNNVTINSIST